MKKKINLQESFYKEEIDKSFLNYLRYNKAYSVTNIDQLTVDILSLLSC